MTTVTKATAQAKPGRSHGLSGSASRMWNRRFCSIVAATLLAIALVGFYPFYLKGEGMGGRRISAELFPLVLAHGTFTTLWFVLFLAQGLLIAARSRRVHMRLGWGVVAVALGITITGFMVAVRSVRPFPEIPFWGMAYR